MKTCTICKQLLDISCFWNLKSSWDGKNDKCITCLLQERAEAEKTPKGMYSLKCRILTTIFRFKWFGITDNTQHLDHKFSISAGFDYGVEPEIICNRANLELLNKTMNLRKGSKCSVTIQELYSGYIRDTAVIEFAKLLENKSHEQLKIYEKLAREKYKEMGNK